MEQQSSPCLNIYSMSMQDPGSWFRQLQQQQQTQTSNETNHDVILVNLAVVLIILITASGLCCIHVARENCVLEGDRSRSSDEQYRQAMVARQEKRKQKLGTLEQRKANLLQSFKRCKVIKVVEAADIMVLDDLTCQQASDFVVHLHLKSNKTAQSPINKKENDVETGNGDSSATVDENKNTNGEYDHKMEDVEKADLEPKDLSNGYLMLTPKRRVSNCCAICLCPYEVGDEVVWSSNKKCTHAFHKGCILDWFARNIEDTPCPFCRQDFTNSEMYRQRRRIRWIPEFAFMSTPT